MHVSFDLKGAHRGRRALSSLFLLILLFAIGPSAGCHKGFPTLPVVTGEVTLDGKPMDGGFITFSSLTESGPYYSANIRKGKYSIQLPEEMLRVQITAFRNVPGRFYEEIPGQRIPVEEQYLPARYNSQSTLTVDVARSKVFNFSLESK